MTFIDRVTGKESSREPAPCRKGHVDRNKYGQCKPCGRAWQLAYYHRRKLKVL